MSETVILITGAISTAGMLAAGAKVLHLHIELEKKLRNLYYSVVDEKIPDDMFKLLDRMGD